jgi:hypothetical protein
MNQEKLIEKLLKELELLADHRHRALDEDGKFDPDGRKRIERVGALIRKVLARRGQTD